MRRLARAMRRVIATSALAASLVALLPAPQASAICGGGAPGEPCYCPSEIKVGPKTIPTGINC